MEGTEPPQTKPTLWIQLVPPENLQSNIFGMSKSGRRGIAPAIGLFFVAPLVAEYLLGDIPIKMLGVLAILAPLYGGGALLIREVRAPHRQRMAQHPRARIRLCGV